MGTDDIENLIKRLKFGEHGPQTSADALMCIERFWVMWQADSLRVDRAQRFAKRDGLWKGRHHVIDAVLDAYEELTAPPFPDRITDLEKRLEASERRHAQTIAAFSGEMKKLEGRITQPNAA